MYVCIFVLCCCFCNARREKSRLDDLRKAENENKFKNLPPRERMRIKKMEQADKEAQRLR